MTDGLEYPRALLQRLFLFDRSPTVEIVMGWVAFGVLLTFLGLVFALLYAIGGGAVGFLLLVGLSLIGVLWYGIRHSGSIARASRWFVRPTGIFFLVFLFAFSVTIVVLLLLSG